MGGARREPLEPDWSREPRGAAEAARRAAYLQRLLSAGSPGWIELLCLAMNRARAGSDLRAAAQEAERLLDERVAARRRGRLR